MLFWANLGTGYTTDSISITTTKSITTTSSYTRCQTLNNSIFLKFDSKGIYSKPDYRWIPLMIIIIIISSDNHHAPDMQHCAAWLRPNSRVIEYLFRLWSDKVKCRNYPSIHTSIVPRNYTSTKSSSILDCGCFNFPAFSQKTVVYLRLDLQSASLPAATGFQSAEWLCSQKKVVYLRLDLQSAGLPAATGFQSAHKCF